MERTEVLRSIAEALEGVALEAEPMPKLKGADKMALLSPVEGGWLRGPAVLLLEMGSRWAASVRDMRY